jgi:hypothetical protein
MGDQYSDQRNASSPYFKRTHKTFLENIMAIRPLAATPRSSAQMTFEDPACEELKAKVAYVTRDMINDLKSKIPIQNKVIEQFTCPITLEVFKEPVMDEHGHTFEKTAIEKNLLTAPLIANLSNSHPQSCCSRSHRKMAKTRSYTYLLSF